MDNSNLAKRMKQYESVAKTTLVRRMPVIIRLDGRSFHTFTKGFKRPFDDVLVKTMQETMKYLCENIQGCVLGYTQSDEITLVLVDYKNLDSQSWFDNEVQKICSIAASMATMAFNKYFSENIKYEHPVFDDETLDNGEYNPNYKNKHLIGLYNTHIKASYKGAMFDARCFNIPKEEVTNNIYWRQLDATRNSIQMVGQAIFSHKELQNKSCNQIQNMLFTQKGINWNDTPTHLKRGSCCVKEKYIFENANEKGDSCTERSRWIIDKEIPVFKGEGREYIDRLVVII